ncbi:MAG: tetrahydrofolate dehydrogenase/cyclohydrolase catalytic domain-containing protein [Thermoplasmata archaeon]
MTARLEGAPLAQRIREELRRAVEAFGDSPPSLVSVHQGAPTPFAFYLRQQARLSSEVGIRFRDRALDASATAGQLRRLLRELDGSPGVDAVLVEHPLPAPLGFRAAVDELGPWKDVDGIGTANLGRLVAGVPAQVPAVARAALALADHFDLPVGRQHVGVVGRSESVGLPLALLLLGRTVGTNATVTVTHSQTPALARALADCRVIFSCVGRPGLLNRSNVPRGAFVIDIGLSSRPDPERPVRHRAVGDADTADLEGWAEGVSPVPGGVGAITVPMLLSNVVEARRHRIREGAE